MSLDEYLLSLRLEDKPSLKEGGSNARLHYFTLNGQSFVVKFLRVNDGIVDGHDLHTFTKKLDQIALIHQECPILSPYYVDVIDQYKGDDGAAFVMPFYHGTSLTHLLGATDDVSAFFEQLTPILTILITEGYRHHQWVAKSGGFEQFYIQRIERRLQILRRYLPASIFDSPTLTINGLSCRSVLRLIVALRAQPEILRRLDPPLLHFPVHGDLNLGNILLCSEKPGPSYVILDPRGTVEPWDAMYDFAKLLFTLTGFHTAMRCGFDIQRPQDSASERPTYIVRVRNSPFLAFERAASSFISFIARLPAFSSLVQTDPFWQIRLLYAHSFHALADAACRISDGKVRYFGPVNGFAARLELALGFYLMGNLLLERLVSAPKDMSDFSSPLWLEWQSNP